jgi:hypothetical protein
VCVRVPCVHKSCSARNCTSNIQSKKIFYYLTLEQSYHRQYLSAHHPPTISQYLAVGVRDQLFGCRDRLLSNTITHTLCCCPRDVPLLSLQLNYWSLYDRLQQTFLIRRRLCLLGRIICTKELICLCIRHRLSTPSIVNTATPQHVGIVCPTSKKCPARSHWYALLLCLAVIKPDADMAQAEKDQYIHALRTHQINTVVELRRIEKAFAVLGTPDVSEPMTAACKRTRQIGPSLELLICAAGSYYVDSHGLLTELRGLTRNYPFRYNINTCTRSIFLY